MLVSLVALVKGMLAEADWPGEGGGGGKIPYPLAPTALPHLPPFFPVD